MFDILNLIKPNKKEEEELLKLIYKFLGKIITPLRKVNAKPIIGGSFAKGTWLKGDHDIDIFVLFKDDENCSNILEKILIKSFKKVERIHGSRDYFQIVFDNINFEIVPVFDIKNSSEARNVTDVSVLHSRWVRENTDEKLKDSIRLTKQFCKAQGVYGAETYIKGFSGYVLEILTIYYGGFNNLLKGALKWEDYQTIDIVKYGSVLNADKYSILNVIDPVQPNRNIAAALSKEKLIKFKKSCSGYLSQPNKKFFVINELTLNDFNKFDILIEAFGLQGSRDIVGTKLLKAYERIFSRLSDEGFDVKENGWYWDGKAYFYFNVANKKLDKQVIHYGPPLSKKEHVEVFKRKYKGYKISESGDKLFVMLPRKYFKLKDFIHYLIKDDFYIKTKVSKIKVIKT